MKFWAIALLVIACMTIPLGSFPLSKASPNDQAEIRSFVQAYFEAKYECFRRGDISPLKPFFLDSQSQGARRELELTQVLLDWRVPRNLFYDDHSVVVNYDSIRLDTNAVTITLNAVVSYRLRNHRVISREANNHTLVLDRHQGKWYVTSDWYEEPIGGMIDAGHSISTIRAWAFRQGDPLTENYREGDHEVCTSVNGPSSLAITYDRIKAVQYADAYWNQYNPAYIDFSLLGGDCTNYVSQCLRAGNVPDDVSGHQGSQWWYNLNTHQYTPSWTSVSALYNYLMFNTLGGPKGTIATDPMLIARGDLVQTDFQQDGTWDHSAIVTEVWYEDTAYIYVNAHTTNRYRYYIGNYPGAKRLIRISIR
ncbi:MAG: hypothetical protein FD169_2534 [Bacillota bacterium]|nr:MAG: hypothetical protein FD169_2534 [Bacillota bacterium]